MAAHVAGTPAELDTPPGEHSGAEAQEVPTAVSTVLARARELVSSALDHVTPGHGQQLGHPGETSCHKRAGAGHREPKSAIASTRGPATATEWPFGRRENPPYRRLGCGAERRYACGSRSPGFTTERVRPRRTQVTCSPCRLRAALSLMRYPALSARSPRYGRGAHCYAMLRARPVRLGCLVDPGRPPLPGFGSPGPAGWHVGPDEVSGDQA